MIRIGLAIAAGTGLFLLGVVAWLRPLVDGPPHFTIEHAIEFAGTPEEAWAVLMNADAYSEWNPYLLELIGMPEPGGRIEIAILQENWEEPMRLTEAVIAVDPPHFFHWRGHLPPKGLFQTDHSFRIESVGNGRVRFTQREEFRGKVAEFLDEEARGHTERAFRAMDEALARRVAALRQARGST